MGKKINGIHKIQENISYDEEDCLNNNITYLLVGYTVIPYKKIMKIANTTCKSL